MATSPKQIVNVRVPQALVAEVRSMAAAEGESTSTVVRRLLRRGLEYEAQLMESAEEAFRVSAR